MYVILPQTAWGCFTKSRAALSCRESPDPRATAATQAFGLAQLGGEPLWINGDLHQSRGW